MKWCQAGGHCNNEELHNLYTSPNVVRVIKSKRIQWAVHVAWMEEMRNTCSIVVGKPEGERPLGRPKHRWENYIVIELREVGWEGVDWIYLAKDSDQWRSL
jgi:hypothetical protein